MNVGTDLDPDSLELKQLQERKEKLHQFEKQLDLKLNEYNTRLSMVSSFLKILLMQPTIVSLYSPRLSNSFCLALCLVQTFLKFRN